MIAAENNADCVTALIAAGAQTNARDEHKATALMAAAASGQADSVYVLLQAKADPTLTRDDGATALSLANNNDGITKQLKDHGATK
jgi:ankyrin repeat protein